MLCAKYLFEDLPEKKYVNPATNVSLVIDSHGSNIYGRLLLPAGQSADDRYPLAIFLHGFPGLEQNLDVLPALRRAGIAAVHFSYRGVWGSKGNYCFSHLMEDTHTLLRYLSERAEQWHLDTSRVYLVCHSMGGFTGLNALAQGIPVKGAVMIAPCDIGWLYECNPHKFEELMLNQKMGYFTLPHDTFIEDDVRAYAKQWRFDKLAALLPEEVPIHFIGASADAITPPGQHIMPIYQALCRRGMKTSYAEFDDGHAFTDHRIALTRLVFERIAQMEKE